MYSENTIKKYLSFLTTIRGEYKKIYTQKELADILEVSQPTMNAFLQGKLIRFDMLEQVAALIGYDFEVSITPIK